MCRKIGKEGLSKGRRKLWGVMGMFIILVVIKTMVYLHNGILCSREKEEAYTLCNSMDGTGEHYAN